MSAPTLSPGVRVKPGDRQVGLREIADVLQVDGRTPTIWRNRSRHGRMDPPFPTEIAMISGNRPVFSLKEVLAWAKKTDRLPTQRAAAAAEAEAEQG